MENWIDTAVKNALNGYLRTAMNGGMPKKDAELIKDIIEDATQLNYCSVAIGQAMLDEGVVFALKDKPDPETLEEEDVA